MVSVVYTTTAADSCTAPALPLSREPVSSCSKPSVNRSSSETFHTYTPSSTSAASDTCSDFCSDDDTATASGCSARSGLVGFFTRKFSSISMRPRRDTQQSDCHSHASSGSTDAGASSDSELSDVQPCSDPFLVYPIALLLRLQAAAANQHAPLTHSSGVRPSSVLGYTVLDESQLPKNLVPCASPAAKVTKASSLPCSSPCSWVSQQKTRANEGNDEKIVRAARSILNKLTIEKFDSLYEQLATTGIRTMGHITSLMQEVFEKATVQHHFIPMYVDLCIRLESDPRILPSPAEAQGRSDAFRRLLLDRCQEAFENLLEAGVGASDSDDEEAKLVRKQRALGNVKFVGQLVARGMLSCRLLVQCSEDLIRARSACAEALESLAAFLTVAAPNFDLWREYPFRTQLNNIFWQVSQLTQDKSIAPRERFLLRDLMELRDSGWPSRTCAAKPSAPMRLDEVRTTAPATPASPQAYASPKRGSQEATPKRGSQEAQTPGGSWVKKQGKQASASKVDTPPRAEHDRSSKAAASRSSPKKQQQAQQPPQQPQQQPQPQPQQQQQQQQQPKQPKQPKQPQQPKQPVSPPAAKSVATPPVAAASGPPAPPQAAAPVVYEPKAFRKVLSEVMRDLTRASGGCGVPAAVGRIRDQNVPISRQATEFADILTRAAEESRGPARRTGLAFAAGLAAADSSAFEKSECLAGTAIFFREVYEDLIEEVPRLPAIVKAELLPTLKAVLPAGDLRAVAPADLWIV